MKIIKTTVSDMDPNEAVICFDEDLSATLIDNINLYSKNRGFEVKADGKCIVGAPRELRSMYKFIKLHSTKGADQILKELRKIPVSNATEVGKKTIYIHFGVLPSDEAIEFRKLLWKSERYRHKTLNPRNRFPLERVRLLGFESRSLSRQARQDYRIYAEFDITALGSFDTISRDVNVSELIKDEVGKYGNIPDIGDVCIVVDKSAVDILKSEGVIDEGLEIGDLRTVDLGGEIKICGDLRSIEFVDKKLFDKMRGKA